MLLCIYDNSVQSKDQMRIYMISRFFLDYMNPRFASIFIIGFHSYNRMYMYTIIAQLWSKTCSRVHMQFVVLGSVHA
jgi:hypothetical protein